MDLVLAAVTIHFLAVIGLIIFVAGVYYLITGNVLLGLLLMVIAVVLTPVFFIV